MSSDCRLHGFTTQPMEDIFSQRVGGLYFHGTPNVPRVKWQMDGAIVGSLANTLQCCGKQTRLDILKLVGSSSRKVLG